MKSFITILLFFVNGFTYAQKFEWKPDTTTPIPKVNFDSNGELVIIASSTSSRNDFDFLVGKWKMYHRRLNKRLENCRDWTEFESTDVNEKILSGSANMDTYTTTQMPGMEGKLFEGLTLRLFNPKTRLWSLYWVASNRGVLDPPMVGSFENGLGEFFAKDTYNGKDILVLFRWDVRDKEHPIWGQAFSPDNGKTWEWNWFNISERIKQ
jgi:hypothetical protein